MQHVSTYNIQLQAKLRTVNALQGGCAHLGSDVAYSVFVVGFLHALKALRATVIPSTAVLML